MVVRESKQVKYYHVIIPGCDSGCDGKVQTLQLVLNFKFVSILREPNKKLFMLDSDKAEKIKRCLRDGFVHAVSREIVLWLTL
jgi:hypothetical protein